MRFKIDWASLIVGRKFTVFASFYFVFEGNFQVKAPGGGGGGLIFGEAYFLNSTVFPKINVTSIVVSSRRTNLLSTRNFRNFIKVNLVKTVLYSHMMHLVLSRRCLVTQPLELKGQCPDYAHAQASYVFSKKDKRTAILT